MDDIDHIQETAALTQDAILARRLAVARLDAEAAVPAQRDCSVCGEAIPPARLRTLPRTRYCFECASDMEKARRFAS